MAKPSTAMLTCKHCQFSFSRSAYNKHVGHCIPTITIEISGQSLLFEREDGEFHCSCISGKCKGTYATANGLLRHANKTEWSFQKEGFNQENSHAEPVVFNHFQEPTEGLTSCDSQFDNPHVQVDLEWPEPLKPLKHIFYQRALRILVCTSCGIVVLPENIYGHVKDQHHISVSAKKRASIDAALTEMGVPTGFVPPLPSGPIPPFPWLKLPVRGFYCRLCGTRCSPSKDCLTSKHIPGCRKGRPYTNGEPVGDASLQRFTLNRIGSSWFRVYPALTNCDPQGRFVDFFQNLPSEAKEGGTLYKSLSIPDQSSSDKLDISPFLSKVKWLDVAASYSLLKMRKTIALPAEGDPYTAIKGLGEHLYSSLASLKGVHHNILSGLLAWRNAGDEFRLISQNSTDGYARSADRLVLSLLRASRRPDGVTVEDNSGAELNGNLEETQHTSGKGKNVRTTRLRNPIVRKSKGNSSIHPSQGEDKDSEANKDDQYDSEDWQKMEDSEDEGNEEEDSDDEEEDSDGEDSEEDESPIDYEDQDVAREDPGMVEWEKSLQKDYSCSLENDHRDMHDLSVDDGKPSFPILLSDAQAHAIENLRSLLDGNNTSADIFLAYTEVVLQVFISQPSGSSSAHQHTPIEAFLMSAAVSSDLSFRTSLQMSSVFSHMQYLCFFVILLECLKHKDPEQRFHQLKSWVDPSLNNALSSIRRYHRLAYRDARNHIRPPDVQFLDSTHFTYQGVSMDVTHFLEVLHSTYKEADDILRNDLLFGLTDEHLGINCSTLLVDNLGDSTPGYGVLASERDTDWKVMKYILETQEVYDKFYYEIDGKRYPRKQAQLDYLTKCTRFRKLLYVLMHWLAGMPKRASEEARFRIANTLNRLRSICFLYGHVGIIGRYCKTSARTGHDKATLHFLPSSVATLLRRFYASVANVEATMINNVVRRPDPDWQAFIFTDKGKRLKSSVLSKEFQNLFPKYPGITLGVQTLRQIIPAIAEEFGVGELSSVPVRNPAISDQMGHGNDVHNRLYARVRNGHPDFTTKFCRETLSFSKALHDFWGFGESTPNLNKAKAKISAHIPGSTVQSLDVEIRTLHATVSRLENQLQAVQETSSKMDAKIDLLLESTMQSRSTVTLSSDDRHKPFPLSSNSLVPTPFSPLRISAALYSPLPNPQEPELLKRRFLPSNRPPSPLHKDDLLPDLFPESPLERNSLLSAPGQSRSSMARPPASLSLASRSRSQCRIPERALPKECDPLPPTQSPSTPQPNPTGWINSPPVHSPLFWSPPPAHSSLSVLSPQPLSPSPTHSFSMARPPASLSLPSMSRPQCRLAKNSLPKNCDPLPPTQSPSTPQPNPTGRINSLPMHSPLFSSPPPAPSSLSMLSPQPPSPSPARSSPLNYPSCKKTSKLAGPPPGSATSSCQQSLHFGQLSHMRQQNLSPSPTSIKRNRNALTDISHQLSLPVTPDKQNAQRVSKQLQIYLPILDENIDPTNFSKIHGVGATRASSGKRKLVSAADEEVMNKRVRVSTCFECGAALASKAEALKHYTTAHKQSAIATVKWAGGKKSKKITYWRSGEDFKFHCKYCDVAFETPADVTHHTTDLDQDSSKEHSVYHESMPAWIRQKYKENT